MPSAPLERPETPREHSAESGAGDLSQDQGWRSAWPRHRQHMGQLRQGRSLVPALEPSCCVGAKQPQQRNVLAEASAKGSKSLNGVGAATAMKLLIVDFRPRRCYGLLKHGEAMRRGHVARGLEGDWPAGRKQRRSAPVAAQAPAAMAKWPR